MLIIPTLYNVVIQIYGLIIRLASPFSPKAKSWMQGRENYWQAATRVSEKVESPVWIHCASLGEFEQGRPLIEELKKRYPEIPILLTFFSPSGYTVRRDYPLVDGVLYLPLDTRKNVNRFLDLLKPRLAIFVKYDFWFNFLNGLSTHSIPLIYIAVKMGPDHFLFRNWARSLTRIVGSAHHIFTQDQRTLELLQKAHVSRVSHTGDTRIDRVIEIQSEGRSFSELEQLVLDKKVVVFGSVWPSDLAAIQPYLDRTPDPNRLTLLAPHDISQSSLTGWERIIDCETERFSRLTDASTAQCILVDTMGDLAYLYNGAALAYVGGGFDKGIHSILEPAAALVPVLFGPEHKNFKEAEELIELGAAICVQDKSTFEKAVNHFLKDSSPETVRAALQLFLDRNKGATREIMDYLESENLLNA